MKKQWLIFGILFLGVSWLYSHPITVDGDDSDWIGSPGSEGTLVFSQQEGIWNDFIGDDVGDGGDALLADDNPSGYTYPLDAQFLGTEADIIEWRVTADPMTDKIYFLIRVEYDLAWMPFIGICVDLDHIEGSGQTDGGNFSEIQLEPINAWEYNIAIYNMQVRVLDSGWNTVEGTHENWFSTENNLIEVAVDVSSWAPSPFGTTVYFTVYSGLQDYDNMRSVDYWESNWQPGGGYDDSVSTHDPKVFDLCFCSQEDQIADLSNYTNDAPTILSTTTVGAINMDVLTIARENETGKQPPICTVYPNPFRDKLHFSIDPNIPYHPEFYNLSGKRLNGSPENFPQGAYFYRIKTPRGDITGKVMKIK